MSNGSIDNLAKRVNLTVPQGLIDEAKALGLNLSSAATAGIRAEVKRAKEEAWREENQEAIAVFNRRVAKEGMLIKPIWELRENGEV